MEMVKGSVGWERMVNFYGVFHLSRIEADPKTKHLADSFRKRQDELERKGDTFKQCERVVSGFEAQLISADYDLDNVLRDLYFSRLAACGNNKKDALLLKWFPEGLSDYTRRNFEEEAGKVASLMAVLKESGDDPVVKRIMPLLQSSFEAYAKSIQGLKSAIASAKAAWEIVESEKVNWLAAYRKNYADILAIYDGDKRKADTFFKKAPKEKKQEERKEEEKKQ